MRHQIILTVGARQAATKQKATEPIRGKNVLLVVHGSCHHSLSATPHIVAAQMKRVAWSTKATEFFDSRNGREDGPDDLIDNGKEKWMDHVKDEKKPWNKEKENARACRIADPSVRPPLYPGTVQILLVKTKI